MALRKLVTIRTISEILPIEGADLIELVRVDGWKSVVKKGQFKIGDKVVYFEIDSFLPIESRFEFLRKNCYKKMVVDGEEKEGFRLRTITLKKKISQGLIMPLSDFPEFNIETDIGIDLSYKIGVIKYEAPVPACIAGEIKRAIPSVIRRTDQERIQNLTEYFTIYKDLEFEETEKEDGTSTTFYLYSNEYGVCGHNWEYKESESNTMWKLSYRYKIEDALRSIGKNIAIQGETVGEGIQSNPMCFKGQHFHIFDVFDIDEGRYMIPEERYEYLTKCGLYSYHVPIVHKAIKVFSVFDSVDKILDYVYGDTTYCKGKKREGSVFKSVKLIDGRNITFKAVDDRKLALEKD